MENQYNDNEGRFVPVINYHAMKTYGGAKLYLHALKTSEMDGGI
jgi:hypothetical protein